MQHGRVCVYEATQGDCLGAKIVAIGKGWSVASVGALGIVREMNGTQSATDTTGGPMTRKEYIEAPYTNDADATARHRAYYGQFVTPGVRAMVLRAIGEAALLASKDPHFNDIPLKWRDALMPVWPFKLAKAVRAQGDYPTLAGAVCIAKEAARQIVEAHKAKGEANGNG